MALNPKLTDLGNKVRLEWTPDLSGQGYRFYVDGVAVSRTFKSEQKSTTFSKPSAGTHRYGVQKMDVVNTLEEVAHPAVTEPPPPVDLPFAEAALANPLRPVISKATKSFACESGKDYLIDLGMEPRPTLVLTGSPRRVHIVNAHFRITDPFSTGAYWRGGLGLQLLAEHVSVTDYLVEDTPTLTDGFRFACLPTTKITLQRARCEDPEDSQESSEHIDCVQSQGPVGRLEVGLATFYAAGVRAPNHGGKCFQLNKWTPPGWPAQAGPFSIDLRSVNMVGLGVPGVSRFGVLLGRWDDDCPMALQDVWARADGAGGPATSWFYPAPSVTGSAPNRVFRFSPNVTGEIREGGTDFVTRALLGV